MINICFSDTARANLREAKYIAEQNGLNIDFGNDFVMFLLHLNQGYISDNGIGSERQNVLENMFNGYIYGEDETDDACCFYKYSMRSLDKVKESIAGGDEFRIWYSDENNEYCSLCWLLSMFDILNSKNNIYVVKMPSEVITPDGKYKRYHSTASFTPEELVEYISKQKKILKSFKSYHVEQWKRVQKENSTLRVSLNNNIVSVGEDFYDSAIVFEAKKFDGIINETELVGKCVSKLNLTDLFVGRRIEYMIEKGLFEEISSPSYSMPFYCKKIKILF